MFGQRCLYIYSGLILLALSTRAFAQIDTDGDGLLDVEDVWLFDPSKSDPQPFTLQHIEDLDGVNQLRMAARLRLGHNRITSIENGDFKGLTNLHWLSLSDNQLTSLESGDFEGLSNLETLWLNGNQISDLESGDFEGLHNLLTLRLNDNQISSIENGDFDGMEKLQSLWLGGNQISTVESEDLDGLMSLKYLGLRGNQISSLEGIDFEKLSNLQSLGLGDNQISSIENVDFAGLSNLQELGLSGNQISRLASGNFSRLSSLQVLGLVDNHITSLESGDFDGLSSLQELSLEDNRITSLEPGVFDGLTDLEALWLSGNQIARIESGAFDGLENLRLLNLAGNKLTGLEGKVFDGLQLRSLNLRGNKIDVLDLSGARLDSLWACDEDDWWAEGFCIDGEKVTSLVLDDVKTDPSLLGVIAREATALTQVSFDGIDAQDPPRNGFVGFTPVDTHLRALLGIDTLATVTVDPWFYDRFAEDFDAFDAMEGKSVTITPRDCNGDGEVSILDVNCISRNRVVNLLADYGTLPGDLDGEDGVGFADFLAFSDNFGLTDALYTDGDFNLDGTVGFPDFLILADNFGQGGDFTSGGAVAVPEPSYVLVLLPAIVLLSRLRSARQYV